MIERPRRSSSFAREYTASAPSPCNCETREAMRVICRIRERWYHSSGGRTCLSGKTICCRLERVADRKLNQPRRPHGTRDFAERAVSSSDGFDIRHRGITKVGVIPNIEKIRGEPQCLPLRQFEILDEREVPILLMRPAKNISAQVPKVGRAVVRVRQNVCIGLVRIAQAWPIE